MQVSLFKLTSGEEIIARIAEHDSIHYLLEDPVQMFRQIAPNGICLLYTSPSPRDGLLSRMPSSA